MYSGVIFLFKTQIMIWIYLIALILYIIGFTFRSCLYKTVSGYSKDIPLAKDSPRLRKRVDTPIWQILLFVLIFFIPLANIFGGCASIAWGLPDNNKFLYFPDNKMSRFFGKIHSFLIKSIWS